MRYLVVIDGEHYPPVTEAAIEEVRAGEDEVVGAVLVGGKEKLPKGGLEEIAGLEVIEHEDPRAALAKGIKELDPEGVLDLSDEPVLDYRRRHELASVALAMGVPYKGADFEFRPPPRPVLATKPTLEVIGTGKRTGKTAIAGFAARALTEAGRRPIVVAMGRGGPPEPQVLHGDEVELEAADLLKLADEGGHAASDYIEDALLGRVTTVGCRRCGGGLAGAVGSSNVAAGVEVANSLEGDFIIMEGSGSALPPVHVDASLLVLPASIPEEYLAGYFGPYRMLLSDVALVTMCEEPFGSPSRISEITSRIRAAFRSVGREDEALGEIRVVRTVFRPAPTRSVEGLRVFVATTAPEAAGEAIKRHLEDECGCEVAGMSHSLSDRGKLEEELGAVRGDVDTFLCEVKAAAVDVFTRWAVDQDKDVVYMDNVPVGIDEDDPKEAVRWTAQRAMERFEKASS